MHDKSHMLYSEHLQTIQTPIKQYAQGLHYSLCSLKHAELGPGQTARMFVLPQSERARTLLGLPEKSEFFSNCPSSRLSLVECRQRSKGPGTKEHR